MFTKVSRIDPLQIITLNEAKEQLNIIDFSDDDVYIESLISAVSDICEKSCNRKFSKVSVECEIPSGQLTFLPYPPVISIVSVQVDGEDVGYTFNDFSDEILINDSSLPSCTPVRVNYQAGYSKENMPDMVKHACKVMVSDFYATRESHSDIKLFELPVSSFSLLRSLRVNIL